MATLYVCRGAHLSVLNHTRYPAGHWWSSSVASVAGSWKYTDVLAAVLRGVLSAPEDELLFALIYKGAKMFCLSNSGCILFVFVLFLFLLAFRFSTPSTLPK